MRRTSSLDSARPLEAQRNLSHHDGGNTQERIRQRAYELYEKGGRRDGHQKEDWAQAEKEIRGQHGFDKTA